jgi:hypothetical protein
MLQFVGQGISQAADNIEESQLRCTRGELETHVDVCRATNGISIQQLQINLKSVFAIFRLFMFTPAAV